MLEKLRAKPDHVKKSIAFAITVVIFSAIVAVWWSSFDARQNGKEAQGKALSPLGGVSQVFQGIVSDVQDSFSRIPSYGESKNATTTNTTETVVSTTTSGFDMSGVVIIDPTAKANSTTTKVK